MIPNYKASCQKLKLNFKTSTYESFLETIQNKCCVYCKVSLITRIGPWSYVLCNKCGYQITFRAHSPYDAKRILSSINYLGYRMVYNSRTNDTVEITYWYNAQWMGEIGIPSLDDGTIDLTQLLNTTNIVKTINKIRNKDDNITR